MSELALEVTHKSEVSPSTYGMGHDPDDYFHLTVTGTVREGDRVVLERSWGVDHEAGASWQPYLPELALDGRALVARWRDGREERIPIPA